MQTSVERGSNEASARRPSDRELMARFLASRDESAFAEIVTRYSRLVMSVALHTLRDPHAAEDAFQAAFLVLARSAGRIRNRDSLASWLHGTAFRVSRRLQRTRLRRKEQDLPNVELTAPIWADPIRPDEQAALDEELARLSEGLRGPLVLHYFEGRTVPEIAAELKMSQSAVEGRLKRGKKTLRKRLLKRGVLLSSAAFGAGLTIPAEAGVAGTLVTATVAACLKTAASASLPPIAATTIQQLAMQEMAAMTRIAILKAALVCGGVAGAIGLAGAGANGTLGLAWARPGGGMAVAGVDEPRFDTEELALAPMGVIQTALAQVPAQNPNVLIEQDGTVLTADALQIGGLELTEARRKDASNAAATPFETRTVRDYARDVLKARVSVEATDEPLSTLLDKWSKEHNVPIQVDGQKQKQVADLLKTPVSVNIKGLKFESVLKSLLGEMSLQHRVEDDGIHISAIGVPGQPTAGKGPQIRALEESIRTDETAVPVVVAAAESDVVINAEGASKTPTVRAHVDQSLKATADIRFTGQTLQEALHFIASHYKIPIVVQRGALQSAGINYENVAVFAGVKGLPLEEALQVILGSVQGGGLGFRVEDDGLHVFPKVMRDAAEGGKIPTASSEALVTLPRDETARKNEAIYLLELRALQAQIEQLRQDTARQKSGSSRVSGSGETGDPTPPIGTIGAGYAGGFVGASTTVPGGTVGPAPIPGEGSAVPGGLGGSDRAVTGSLLGVAGLGTMSGTTGMGGMAGMMGSPPQGSAGPPRPKAIDDLLKVTDKVQAKAIRDYLSRLEQGSDIANALAAGSRRAGAPPSGEVREFRPQSPAEDRIRESMDRIVDFQFTGQTLQEVMNFLSTSENIVIRLDTTALTEAGVGPDQEINLVVSGISLRSALNLMLQDVAGTALDYVIDNDVMMVTTKEKADKTMQTVIYDVSGLGTVDANWVASTLEKTVEPQSWEKAGGQGTIITHDNAVMVTTSRRLQDKAAEIMELLQQQAKAQKGNP